MTSMLVVEDDDAIAEVVAYQLRKEGYDVNIAADGVAALQALRNSAVDLVILDLMLPRLSGIEVLRSLRRDSETPVIVLSARDRDADQIEALELGADDYVTKPFSVRQLLARVAAVLRRSRSSDVEPDAVTGDLVIDAARHEVRKHGEVIPLAPKEFELLLYLARHADQVCSRDEILNAVWGYEYGGDTRTVDVHVHWLRRKIEDAPSRPVYLQTVRQYGYRLTTDRPVRTPHIPATPPRE